MVEHHLQHALRMAVFGSVLGHSQIFCHWVFAPIG
jgi:hypothetical protein